MRRCRVARPTGPSFSMRQQQLFSLVKGGIRTTENAGSSACRMMPQCFSLQTLCAGSHFNVNWGDRVTGQNPGPLWMIVWPELVVETTSISSHLGS